MRASFGLGSVDSPLRRAYEEDALVGGVAVHVGMMPDLIGEVGRLNWFTNAPRRGPLLRRLLSKALPQRCQFRNFRDTCAGACRECPLVAKTMKGMIFCTLGGYYGGAATLASTDERRWLYSEWLNAPIDVASWCEEHPLLAFYALKDYLVYAVQFDPALRDVVGPRYCWQSYSEIVKRAMVGMRMAWRTAGGEPRVRAAATWLRRYHSRVPVFLCRVGCGTPLESMIAAAPLVTRPVCTRMLCAVHAAAARHCLGTPERVFAAVGRALGWSYDACDVAGWEGSTKARMALLGSERDGEVASAAHLIAFVNSVVVLPLPQHFYDRQYAALCARHAVSRSDEAAVRRAARTYACTVCRSFKGFVIPARPSARNQTRAFGHHKIAYDDVSGRLFCSHHKNERQQGNRPKLVIRGEDVRSLGVGTGLCESTPCVPFSLLGNVAVVFGVGYTLCCRCGAPINFASAQIRNGDWLCCGVCARSGAVPSSEHCLFCDRTNHGQLWQRVLVAESYEHDCVAAMLCPRHGVRVSSVSDAPRVWLKEALMRRVGETARGRVA